MSELDLRGNEYLPGGLQQQVLLVLSIGNYTVDRVWDTLVHPLKRMLSITEFQRECLDVLEHEGHVSYFDSKYSLTSEGRVMLNFLASQNVRSKTLTIAAKKEYTVPEGSYQGDELKVSTPRRGAYDFLALPSRYGDDYVQHPTAHLAKE
jgi:hypothetical protein